MNFQRALLCTSAVLYMSVPCIAWGSVRSTGSVQASSHAATHPASKHATPEYIRVHAGDTLWHLSGVYHVSVKHLEQWNHLNDNSTLQIGQKLIVGWRTGSRGTTLSGRGETAPSNLADAAFGATVAQYATQFVGVPYRWGGESTSGFDCSGLVQFTFGHFGVALGRSSYDQYQEGVAVSRDDLVPGDLVFFNTDGGGPSHVGIYLGGGQFVNAESSGVRVDSMNSGYWASHYIGARRVH